MKLLSTIFLLFFSVAAHGATFTVTRSDDRNNPSCEPGDCSLREAVNNANSAVSNDTINFASSVTTITLTNEIVINNAGALTINGLGANVLTIDGGAGTNRIFSTRIAPVTITGVTLTGGNSTGASLSGGGGAIHVHIGTLVLDGVHVTANSASSINGGGGVYIDGGINHQIINSTFSANSAYNCGGFFNDGGTLTVTNSTFSGNSATGGSGGGFCSSGNTTLRSVTVSSNSAVNGGGLHRSSGALNLGNTIVAGNTVTGFAPNILLSEGTITTSGYNLIGSNQGVTVTFPAGNPNANNDIVGTITLPVNPLLGPLQNNGGTTLTRALLSGSPAINAGDNIDAPTTDQRGFARIIGGIIDIGAFEFAPAKSNKRIRISF